MAEQDPPVCTCDEERCSACEQRETIARLIETRPARLVVDALEDLLRSAISTGRREAFREAETWLREEGDAAWDRDRAQRFRLTFLSGDPVPTSVPTQEPSA